MVILPCILHCNGAPSAGKEAPSQSHTLCYQVLELRQGRYVSDREWLIMLSNVHACLMLVYTSAALLICRPYMFGQYCIGRMCEYACWEMCVFVWGGGGGYFGFPFNHVLYPLPQDSMRGPAHKRPLPFSMASMHDTSHILGGSHRFCMHVSMGQACVQLAQTS